MVGPPRMTAVLWAALGAAAAYYGLGFLRGIPGFRVLPVLGIMAVFCAALCLFRVLSGLPAALLPDPRRRYGFRRAAAGLGALTLGLSLGLAARGGFSSGLDLGLSPGELTGAVGLLRDDPRAFGDDGGMGTLELRYAYGKGGLRASARGVLPVFFPSEAVPRIRTFGRGCEVYLEGKMIPRGNAGETYIFRSSAVHITAPAPALEQFRTALRGDLTGRFAPFPWGGLASALLLGVKDDLDGALSGAFREAGCSHVLALSGMHLAIVASLIAFLLRRPLGKRGASMVGGAGILLYVFLAGPQPSLARAAVMYLLGSLALLKALPRPSLSILGLTFLIQLCLSPASGDSPSFILSYLALGGILSAGEAIHDLSGGTLPEVLSRPLAASLGAFIATAGVSAAFFGELRPVGILAGLFIVPLSTAFMIAAIAFLVLSLCFPPGAALVGKILSLMYDVLSRFAGLAARAPGFPVSAGGPAWVVSLLILALLMLWWRRRFVERNRLAAFEPG